MTYISCPNCGHKALSIATRCPHCGQAFEGRLWRSPASVTRRPGFPKWLIVAVVLIGIVAVGVVQRNRRDSAEKPPPSPPPTLTDTTPRAAPPAPAAQPGDSMVGVDSIPPIDSASPTADRAIAPAPAPAPPVAGPEDLRYASTWVNVRAGRSVSAPVVRVLQPGDSIRVDSLRQGWYRVVADGQTLGYVDRSLVGTAPDSVSP